MSHKAGLCTTGTVTKTKHHKRQVIITDKTCNTVVHHGHREEGGGAFFGLHTTGRDKAHNRQLLACTFHHEFAEFLGTGHVEGTGLKIKIRYQGTYALSTTTDVDFTQTGNHTTRRDVLFQGTFYRGAEARELHWIGRHQVAVNFFEVREETTNDGIGRSALGTLGVV